MITTTQSYSCRVCNSANIVKAGKERNGNQKYKCKDCKTSRVVTLKPIYSPERREEIMKAYHERVSIRGLRRTYGVSTQTVLNWIKKNS